MLEMVIEKVLWAIRGFYQILWTFTLTNLKWHSVAWPYTMTIFIDQTSHKIVTLLLKSTFYIIMIGLHRRFSTGVTCRQGTLTPPDTWSCLVWGLHIFLGLRPLTLSMIHKHVLVTFSPDLTNYQFWHTIKVSMEHLQRMRHADRDAFSSGHLVPSNLGLAYVLLVETNPFPEHVVIFSCNSNIPRYFLNFAL